MRSLTLWLLASIAAVSSARAQTIARASIDSNGVEANAPSFAPTISDDGRFVAFSSAASNLAPADHNGSDDVFVRDRLVGVTGLVSATPTGEPGDAASDRPVVSANGRWIAFHSFASNLVAGDRNATADVFVRDRIAGTTTRVSVDLAGAEGDGYSVNPAISGSGRFVAFVSVATNLVAGDTNGCPDVFVFDGRSGVTTRVSVRSDGGQSDGPSFACAISREGRWVAFVADAPSLEPPGMTARFRQLFLHDRTTGVTTLVTASGGVPAPGHSDNPVLSADGRFLAFESDAELAPGASDPLRDVFCFDRITGVTSRASVGPRGQAVNVDCRWPAISPDGRWIAFNATNDALLFDRETGTSAFLSVDASGTPVGGLSGDGGTWSRGLALAAGAHVVAYGSLAVTLVPGDANGATDVFIHRRTSETGLTIDSITPSSGAESGGELMRMWGSGFGSITDTAVRLGGTAADVTLVASDHVVVRTPPGVGVADVDVALGDRESPLTLNDSAGDAARDVVIRPSDPIRVSLAIPSSRTQSAFALYAWVGAPSAATLSATRRGLGDTVFPSPLSRRSPQPRAIWNNIGIVRALGAPTMPSSPAPTVVLSAPQGIPHRATFTVQGIVQDAGSRIVEGFSVTNAVVVRVQ
ncbi:MAG: PD40 domain-containing protein [Planctomycetes bacterium]|nr:PD40 domain-containing protein [Planctomycetota bacterium]